MSKEIYCAECAKHVGTIEVGSLLAKGLVYTCQKCSTKNSVFKKELEQIRAQRAFLEGFKYHEQSKASR